MGLDSFNKQSRPDPGTKPIRAHPYPQRDVEYLLAALDRFMPEAGLDREKVRFVYSGFRALLCSENGDLDSAAAPREDQSRSPGRA